MKWFEFELSPRLTNQFMRNLREAPYAIASESDGALSPNRSARLRGRVRDQLGSANWGDPMRNWGTGMGTREEKGGVFEEREREKRRFGDETRGEEEVRVAFVV